MLEEAFLNREYIISLSRSCFKSSYFWFKFSNSNKSDAEGLIDVSGGFSVDSYELFTEKINWLLDKNNYNNSSKNCKSFVTENSGSTEKILKELYE